MVAFNNKNVHFIFFIAPYSPFDPSTNLTLVSLFQFVVSYIIEASLAKRKELEWSWPKENKLQPQHKIVHKGTQCMVYHQDRNYHATKLQAWDESRLSKFTLMEHNNFIHAITSHPSPSSTRMIPFTKTQKLAKGKNCSPSFI